MSDPNDLIAAIANALKFLQEANTPRVDTAVFVQPEAPANPGTATLGSPKPRRVRSDTGLTRPPSKHTHHSDVLAPLFADPATNPKRKGSPTRGRHLAMSDAMKSDMVHLADLAEAALGVNAAQEAMRVARRTRNTDKENFRAHRAALKAAKARLIALAELPASVFVVS